MSGKFLEVEHLPQDISPEHHMPSHHCSKSTYIFRDLNMANADVLNHFMKSSKIWNERKSQRDENVVDNVVENDVDDDEDGGEDRNEDDYYDDYEVENIGREYAPPIFFKHDPARLPENYCRSRIMTETSIESPTFRDHLRDQVRAVGQGGEIGWGVDVDGALTIVTRQWLWV
ncbi:hypothetical protein EK21DRAFT_85956 [Setomelanomma holmii]|uniref:Uncharacterized protein n=1 Tax=Setomelanomma holmii TaxID=210430 RepID=A0A9P4LQ44_9PLEO|nr:hypothetical protein EK21DRAFT_85956 [Setomelanomma holmii]